MIGLFFGVCLSLDKERSGQQGAECERDEREEREAERWNGNKKVEDGRI